MLRRLLMALVAGLFVLLAGAGTTSGAPPTTPPPPTTVAATATTSGGATTAGPVLVVTEPLRGGTGLGAVPKPGTNDWTIRQVATVLGAMVIGLALLGFVYGRIRSTAPRRSTELARIGE